MSGPHRETPKIDRARKKPRQPNWVAKPKVGDKLGSFRLLKLLGEGGAGVVFRAEHSFLKRPVAIKVLHPELYLRPAMVARFFQEALAVNRARHPNITDITDGGGGESYPPFIVMELLEGEDLGDYIDKYAPAPVSLTAQVVTQICDALSVVHGLGIVHRDLKPENIFLAGLDGEDRFTVKLLDFGIAKFLDSEENRRRTWSGNVLGTPAYMPLEQLHGLPVDHRADIYAVGVVIYELLTGRLPFEVDSVDDLASQRLTLEPPPPSTRTVRPPPEPISPALDRVVLRCLTDDPTKRFQSVAELRKAFVAATQESETSPAEAPSGADLPRRADSADGLDALPRIPTPDEGAAPASRPLAANAQDATEAEGATNAAGTAAAEEPAATHDTTATPAADKTDKTDKTDVTAEMDVVAQGSAARATARRRWLVVAGVALVAMGAPALWWVGSRGDAAPTAGHAPAGSPTSTPAAHAPSEGRTSLRQAIRVRITSTPNHAKLHRADTGELVGQTPATVGVKRGAPQTFELRQSGYAPARITVRPDGPNPLRVWLDPARRRAASPGADRPPAPAARRRPRARGHHAARRGARRARTAPSHAGARRPTPRPDPRAMSRDRPRPRPRVTEHGIVDPFSLRPRPAPPHRRRAAPRARPAADQPRDRP